MKIFQDCHFPHVIARGVLLTGFIDFIHACKKIFTLAFFSVFNVIYSDDTICMPYMPTLHTIHDLQAALRNLTFCESKTF